jgi:hypothetical protein
MSNLVGNYPGVGDQEKEDVVEQKDRARWGADVADEEDEPASK